MGTDVFSLEKDRKNPLVTGIGFILTIIYTFVITSYFEAVGELIIFSVHSRTERLIILLVAIATTGYLILFAVENYLWTEQYERGITPQEYRFEILQHTFHILGTLLLLAFAESQTLILTDQSLNMYLFLLVPLLALAIRYLFFTCWQTISFIRDTPEGYRLHMIGIWVQNPDILDNDSKFIKESYAGLVEWILPISTISNNEGDIKDQIPIDVSIQKINSVRNSVCTVPFYLIMFLAHLIIPALTYSGVFPESIYGLLSIPILIIVYIFFYYIIWRPFYFELYNVEERTDSSYQRAG